MILNLNDPLIKLAGTRWDRGVLTCKAVDEIFAGKGPYALEGNPTAENLAKELWRCTHELIPTPMTIYQVRMWETPTCYADFQPSSR
jgi:hypothetical protein